MPGAFCAPAAGRTRETSKREVREGNVDPMPAAASKVSFATRRAAHLRLGRRGERLARRLLRELGLDILALNYRSAAGEIDIVARDGNTLCFVEVKTRRHAAKARPAEAVGRAKRSRIIRTAHRYLRELGRPPVLYRFDIVEVVLQRRRVLAAHYWPQAFTEDPERRQRRDRWPAWT